jgi:hypothetical protein
MRLRNTASTPFKILEHLRPVIEREADLTFGEWTVGGTEPVQLRLAA